MADARLQLRFELSGRILDVVEFRRDGWPICPGCNDDELAAIAESGRVPIKQWEEKGPVLLERLVKNVDLCYQCGPVEVVAYTAPESEPLPGIT
jgi:hypothetical protein